MGDYGVKTSLQRILSACLPSLARKGPPTLEQALPFLVPKVRPRFMHEALNLLTGKPGPVFQPLAGIYAVSLVVDLPDRETDVDADLLDAWNVDFDRLMQKARSNLLARGGEEGFQEMGPGRYRSLWEDNLDGSRVLLPGILQRLRVTGDPVVLLPNRDTLLVVGSEDPDSLSWALEGALEFMNDDPRSLNGFPLRLWHYHWEPFQARREHPVCPLLAQMETRRLLSEYAHQKALLDKRHGASGQAITVAPFQVEPGPGGGTTSFTVWSPAMGEAWLPVADRVRLGWELGGEPGKAWVPWAKVQERFSHLLEPVGLFPERYRFKQVPPAGLLESLLN
ncbi:MAG: hypothetical protein P4L36_11960 [Holophaga sp.]|nr:hypothetical protein [Holophaga sp.]